MSAQEQGVAQRDASLKRLRLALVVAVALLVAGAVALGLLRPRSEPASSLLAAGTPSATWAAGEKPAPDFRLTDAYGKPVSIAALHGRRVILTFVDPHCTTFCPRESLVLNDALRSFPVAERPAVVAVSVDPKTRSLPVLRREAKRFKWLPQWRWAAGEKFRVQSSWNGSKPSVKPRRDWTDLTAATTPFAAGSLVKS